MKELVNNEQQLKAYFEQIFKLSKQGKQFPVDLEMVWSLVYSEKGKAVRALKADFIEGVDYQILRQNPKNSKGDRPENQTCLPKMESADYQVLAQNGKNLNGGRPTETYHLSLSCMEFFIARKVRPVFEVYRQVTHRVHQKFHHFSEMADHKKIEVQKQNSKEVNAFQYFNNGVEDLIEYNRRNCVEHTGRKPSEWKEIGKQMGLSSKERSSGKEVIRNLQPEAACAMSFTDNLIKQGWQADKAFALSKAHALPLFKGLLEMGFTPNELYQ